MYRSPKSFEMKIKIAAAMGSKTKIILGSSIKKMLPDEKKFGRRKGLYFLKNITK